MRIGEKAEIQLIAGLEGAQILEGGVGCSPAAKMFLRASANNARNLGARD